MISKKRGWPGTITDTTLRVPGTGTAIQEWISSFLLGQCIANDFLGVKPERVTIYQGEHAFDIMLKALVVPSPGQRPLDRGIQDWPLSVGRSLRPSLEVHNIHPSSFQRHPGR